VPDCTAWTRSARHADLVLADGVVVRSEHGAGDRGDMFVVGAAAATDDAQIEALVQVAVERGELVDVAAVDIGRGIELVVAEPGGVCGGRS
jgi:hypothetical protein